ncbi:hypothetical protein PTSG_08707 [Salpingoeca rosetta]|uniref:C3H1-type domain-containing protein n=1 Tax=Salpingoeca rosetta (strain ATCC 50818 / BSB-021) TaxID=946362 RepID=F2UKG3_SALR5|nr:uncharacterized protein PTSG_08707 [Salpingoeca rosetta]EGD77612.1 hypothetical protein PTSG_08707 [Salpingoeca rosetta]|eukprot:XP_004990500.1 hypothetical protein PTSG_08707 [Salpingoeca rosetta]
MTMMKAALRAAALSSCAVGVAAAAATINNGRASGTSLAFSTTTTATATSKNSGAQQRSRMAAAASGDGSGSATAQEQPLSQQQQPQFKKAIVIGGGVVGVTTAAELAKRGIQVTLIEAGSGFANECSYAAAGGMQRTNPQVNRDSWRATVKSWLASLNPFRANDAPLPGVFISPKVMFDPQFRRWFRLFTVSSLYRSQEDQAYQTQHMLDFTDWAVDSILNVMHEDDGFLAKAANLNTTGALKLLYDECDLDPERHRMFNGREPWGFVQKQDLATVEPSLTSFRPPHTPPCGAIIQYRAAQAHCARFTKAFAERHLEGVEVQTDTRIKELTLSDDETRVAAITTEDRTIDVGADTVVVLAAGSWTPVLSRTAGRFVPVYPMKGYTLLANAADADTQQGERARAQRKAEQEEKAMMNSLFKPVRPKVKPLPQKKKKVEKEPEPEKKDLYTDDRDKKQSTSADWDQATLEKVVNERHGKKKQPPTDKVCKYFLDAVEKGKYGWFWTCPNGGDDCKYRHALPPGYVLKKDRKKKQEEEAKMTLEELIDRERAELSKRTNLTPVNPDTFAKWKKKKIAEKKKALKEANKKKKKEFLSGNTSAKVTGRDFFSFRPEMGGTDTNDDEGGTFDDLTKKDKENNGEAQDGQAAVKEFDASVYDVKHDDDDEDDDDDDDEEDEGDEKKQADAKKAEANKKEEGVSVGAVAVDADLFADEMGDLDLDNV